MLMLATLALLVGAEPPAPQPAEESPFPMDREVVELAKSLGDWDDQATLIESMITNMWADNGWNTEADLAARDAALDISRIPPWKLSERLDRVSDIVKDRYGMNAAQSSQFREMIYKETVKMGFKYGPMMVREAKELLQTRVNGEPFTPDQIARLEKAFDPVVDDLLEDVNRMTTDLNDLLTPAQREIFQRDLESFHKRTTHFLAERERWKAGHWEPSAWGLQDDPVHREAVRRARAAALPVRGRAVPHDETTWHRHVDAVIAHYALDRAQQNAARALLDGAVASAAAYRKVRREAIRSLPPREHATAPLLQPICDEFAVLQMRLEGLPTEKQRQQAAPGAAVESRRGER